MPWLMSPFAVALAAMVSVDAAAMPAALPLRHAACHAALLIFSFRHIESPDGHYGLSRHWLSPLISSRQLIFGQF